LPSYWRFAHLDKVQIYSYISCASLKAKFFQELKLELSENLQSAYESFEKDVRLESFKVFTHQKAVLKEHLTGCIDVCFILG